MEIEKISAQHDMDTTDDSINVVYYEHRVKELIKKSIFSKIFFDKNNELKMLSIKGISLIILFVLGFIITLLCIIFSIIFIYFLKEFLELGLKIVVVFLTTFISLIFTIYYFYIPLNRIVIHRIIKAPQIFTGFKHHNAEIEFFGKTHDYEYNIARITEIRAECPICTAPILLMDGKPDQFAPLVGRCIEAPHAHVYSFDRVLMKGYFLGHPMYLQDHLG